MEEKYYNILEKISKTGKESLTPEEFDYLNKYESMEYLLAFKKINAITQEEYNICMNCIENGININDLSITPKILEIMYGIEELRKTQDSDEIKVNQK